MALVGSDGLSLLVGDGAGSETFSILKGAHVTRLDVTQRGHVSTAISSDAWQVQVGVSNRQAVIECESYTTDDAQALRVKSLALSGALGNFKLQLRSAETMLFSALVTHYREVTTAGEIKKTSFRLESSAAVSLV